MTEKFNVIIPLIHQKNDVISGTKYSWRLSFPRLRRGEITSTQFFLIDKSFLQWCAKGIVVKFNIIAFIGMLPSAAVGE